MGNNLCSVDHPTVQEVTQFPANPPSSQKIYLKTPTLSLRFGQVQKVKTQRYPYYKLILPLSHSIQIMCLECPILSNYSDMEMYSGTKVNFISQIDAPIIDIFDQSDRYIFHKVQYGNTVNFTKTNETRQSYLENNDNIKYLNPNERDSKLLKIYSFDSYRDVTLANALYEIYLHKSMPGSSLKDFFIIERGKPMSIVMIFDNYKCSLFDLIMYRSMANIPWTKNEIVYIVQQLINGYRDLSLNNIAHRDIRASKIFLKDRNKGQKKKDEYNFVDLESARKLTRADLRDPNNLLLTVRGVGYFCDQRVKSMHLNDAQVGSYPYQLNDRVALVRVICSLVRVQPYTTATQIKKSFPKINEICQMLMNPNVHIQTIVHSYDNLAQQYRKQPDYGNLKNDINFSELLSKKLIVSSQRQRIKSSVIENMFLMHLKSAFMPKLMTQINQNYKNRTEEANLPILHRMGSYYESIGVKNNDYFRQQVNLLCLLGQQERIRGFLDRQNQYIQRAQQVESRLNQRMKTNATMASLYTEKAMNQLYHKNDPQRAQEFVNQALLIGGKDNSVPIETQLKVIQAKGLIQNFIDQNREAGCEYFEKGLDLASQRSNFNSKTQQNVFLATFQYRMAQDLLNKLKKNKSDSRIFNRRNIAKIETYLKSSIETRQGLQNQTANLALSLEALGDLYNLIEQYPESKQSYKRADVLMRTAQREVAPDIQIRVLKKVKESCQLMNEDDQINQVESRIRHIQRIRDGPKKKSRRAMRFGNDRKKSSNYGKGYDFGQDFRNKSHAIEEVSEQYDQQMEDMDQDHKNRSIRQ